MAEERLDFVVADFSGEAADKDLAVASLGLFGVDLLVVDDVLTGCCHFVQRIGRGVYDEGETTAAPGLRVGFDVDALNLTILTKVFAQLLCG